MPAIWGYTNSLKTAGISSTSEEAALPSSNVANDQGSSSTAWQTTAATASATLTATLANTTTLGAVGLFRSNLTSSASVTLTLYRNPSTVVGTYTAAPTYGQVVFTFADVLVDYLTVAISDNTNPDLHLNVPLMFAGPVWRTIAGLSWSSTMGRDDITDTVVTRGGQQYVDMRATSKRWEIAMDLVRPSELFTQLDQLDRTSRLGGNVLLIPSTTSTLIAYEAIFGILKATGDFAYPYSTDQRRSWRARLTERL